MAGVGQADGEAEKHLNGELPPEPEDRDGAAGPGAEDGAKKKRKKKKKGKVGPAGRGRPPAGRVLRAGGTRGLAAGGAGGRRSRCGCWPPGTDGEGEERRVRVCLVASRALRGKASAWCWESRPRDGGGCARGAAAGLGAWCGAGRAGQGGGAVSARPPYRSGAARQQPGRAVLCEEGEGPAVSRVWSA